MSRMITLLHALSFAGGLSACMAPPSPACAPGMGSPASVFTLYFGQAIAGRGDLTGQDWQAFLDSTITANLPNGYTVLNANGAWRNPITGKTIAEATKMLVVALPDMPVSLAAVNRIRSAYRIKFQQQLVGMTVEQACATF